MKLNSAELTHVVATLYDRLLQLIWTGSPPGSRQELASAVSRYLDEEFSFAVRINDGGLRRPEPRLGSSPFKEARATSLSGVAGRFRHLSRLSEERTIDHPTVVGEILAELVSSLELVDPVGAMLVGFASPTERKAAFTTTLRVPRLTEGALR